jgi:hypothetical protein
MDLETPGRLRRHLADRGIELTTLADGSAVLLDLDGHRVLTLNATGTWIMQQVLESEASADAIARSLSEKHRIPPDRAQSDVNEFLSALSRTLSPDGA